MVKDLDLMIDYAEHNVYHYSALKSIYMNRVNMYDDSNWDMTKYYNRL